MSFKPSGPVFCIEYFHAKQGLCDELVQALLSLIERTKAEFDCLQYDLMLDNQDSNLIILIVKFSNQEAMTRHEQHDDIQYFIKNDMKAYCEKFVWYDGTEIIKS